MERMYSRIPVVAWGVGGRAWTERMAYAGDGQQQIMRAESSKPRQRRDRQDRTTSSTHARRLHAVCLTESSDCAHVSYS